MLEKVKWYAVELIYKKYLPVGIAAGFTALGTYLAAHAGELKTWGIYYGVWPMVWAAGEEPVGDVLLIKMSVFKATVGLAVIGLVAMAARALQHHTTGTPIVPGGNRAGDPPKSKKEDQDDQQK